jgi:chromatin segregation and condensation protein Rec8/ScpA/Scc1 (kleisin family)
MTKLNERLAAREEARAALLEAQREYAAKKHAAEALVKQFDELQKTIKRKKTQLVALTAEVTQLLHADLAGLVGTDREIAEAANGAELAQPAAGAIV